MIIGDYVCVEKQGFMKGQPVTVQGDLGTVQQIYPDWITIKYRDKTFCERIPKANCRVLSNEEVLIMMLER